MIRKKMTPRLLTLVLTMVFIFSQSIFAYAANTATHNVSQTSSNKPIMYSQKDGVTYYYVPGQSTPVSAIRTSDSSTGTYGADSTAGVKDTTSSSKDIPATKNVKKGTLSSTPASNNNVTSQSAKSHTKDKISKGKQTNRPAYVADEIIVKFKSNVSDTTKNSIYSKNSLKKSKTLNLVKADVVKLPKGTSVESAMNTLKADKNVESVQPNYLYYPDDFTPPLSNDPLSGELWGLENVGQTDVYGQTGTEDIDIDVSDAWKKTQGSDTTVVGIIDTGIDYNHPDLAGRIWTNSGEIPNNGKDDDGNGYIDDVNGWDFYNNDNTVFDAQDGDNHGTHVAGTIAADLNNNKGVAGIAPNVKIMSLKFLGPNGGSTEDAVTALEYAQKMGVKILNNSWGGGGYDPLLKFAIESSGALFVAAAGNDSWNNDTYSSYPASYDNDNILSVAAVDNQGSLAYFSNYGYNTVDVAAPGVSILSTVPKKPTLGAAIQSDNGIYKTLFQGFGLESVKTAAEQNSLMSKALQFFGVTSSDKVLLVQDNESSQSSDPFLGVYQSALSAAGYTSNVTVNTVGASSDGPGLTDLSKYKLVIWFTGNAMGQLTGDTCLTPADRDNLTTYLKNGGKLYLSGRDAGWNIEYTDFYNNYLHANFLFEEDNMPSVSGVSTSFTGQRYNLNPTNYMDYLKPNDSVGKVALNFDGELNYDNAYAYYDGTSMATPHVTGIAALLYSSGIQDPEQIKSNIMGSVTPLESLNGLVMTGGMVNANNALTSQPDDDIPGIQLKETNSGSLDQENDLDDVYYVDLVAGQEIKLNLTGDQGTDFDLYIYGPDAMSVKSAIGLIAASETAGTSTEALDFRAEGSGRYYVDVYGYAGTGNYTLVYQNIGCVLDDKDAPLEYSGPWVDLPQNDKYYNGTAKQLNASGSMEYSFLGSNVKWIGMKGPNQGKALVYIDGKYVQEVSLYSPAAYYQQSIFGQEVGYGFHTLKITWEGLWDRAARKTATAINIDKIEVTSVITKPQAPQNLTATGLMDKVQLNIDYTDSSRIQMFVVYRSEDGVNFHKVGAFYPESTSLSYIYVDSDVDNKNYTYKVTALDFNGTESDPSNIANATPLISNSDYVLEDTSNHVQYTGGWTTVYDPKYSNGTLHVTTTAGDKAVIPFTGYSSTLIIHSGPSMGTVNVTFPGGDYTIPVDLNDSNDGYWSFSTDSAVRETGSTWTVQCVSGQVNFDVAMIQDIDIDAPTAPVSLTGAKNATGQGVTLTWPDNPEPDVAGYNVYRSTTSGSGYAKINTDLVTDLQYADNTIQPNTNYYYVIKAVSYANLESAPSNEARIKQVLAAPTGLTGALSGSSVNLNWTKHTDPDVTGYNVYRSTTSGTGYTKLNSAPITVLLYVDSTIQAGITYYYTITAVDKSGLESGKSNEVKIEQASPALRIEETDKGAIYTGTWGNISSSNYSGGNQKQSTTKGSYVEFTFIGTGIRWISMKNTSKGIANVYIDGVSVGTVDTYNKTSLYQQAVYENTSLSPGTHTIKVEVSGNKNGSSSSTQICIDAFEVLVSPIVRIEETDKNAVYTGTWGNISSTNYSGGNQKQSTTKGSYVEFTFIGTGIRWISMKNTSKGIANIYIDGVSVETVDTYNKTSLYQQAVYESTSLSPGTHTIKVEVSGNKNGSSSSTQICIDAFEVLN